MNLDVDKQTLDDLAIFENGYRKHSVFNLFNHTRTIGGKEKLVQMFGKPLTDPGEINERIAVFEYLYKHDIEFKADKNTCDFAEFYLKKHYKNKSFPVLTGFIEKIIYLFNNNNDYYVIQRGVDSTIILLGGLLKFASNTTELLPVKLDAYRSIVNNTLQSAEFVLINQLIAGKMPTAVEIAKADHLLRQTAYDKIKILLGVVYELDVYQSVSFRGKELGFTLPVIEQDNGKSLIVKGLFHPLIKNPVVNDIEFNADKNVCFITGTNMAGKSTLLKSIGISIYLSQLGFPVPAAYLQTSLFKGLITTINLSDDVNQGYSHFYAEVLRVKAVAQKINSSGDIFVAFDELFRGTNVKDAYDASLAIISAFAKVNTCFFVVSTHIVEVAHDLTTINTIDFQYMETLFEDDEPKNSYLLKKGITEERLGMWIVKNEKILEIIEGSVKT